MDMLDFEITFDRAYHAVLWTAVTFVVAVVGCLIAAFWDLRWFDKYGTYKTDLGPVAAFSTHYSVESGEPLPVHIHTTAPATASLVRFGAERVDLDRAYPIGTSVQSRIFNRRTGYAWAKSLEIDTEGLASGFYGLDIRQDDDPDKRFVVPFAVKPVKRHAVAVVLSTNDWDAYNEFGGLSKYENKLMGRMAHRLLYWTRIIAGRGEMFDQSLPNARPNGLVSDEMKDEGPLVDYHSKLARNEWNAIAFLEREGIDYAVYTNEDLDNDERVLDSALLMFVGHSEYFTEDMFYAYDRYVENGGKVLISSGMAMAGVCTYEPGAKAYQFKDLDHEICASRTGTFFSSAGGYTAAPYRVVRPDSWVFRGTGLGPGSFLGAESAHKAGPKFAAVEQDRQSGASGAHLGVVGRGSSKFELLARGMNERGGACMMLRETASGGWIFSTASETFFGAAHLDPNVGQLLRNLVNNAIQGASAKGAKSHHAPELAPSRLTDTKQI